MHFRIWVIKNSTLNALYAVEICNRNSLPSCTHFGILNFRIFEDFNQFNVIFMSTSYSLYIANVIVHSPSCEVIAKDMQDTFLMNDWRYVKFFFSFTLSYSLLVHLRGNIYQESSKIISLFMISFCRQY